ncbi:Ff.00g114850.m01.CDS01 [Fusarium sp. VM40]|nr:Ff.00g114850.m01.CDS01 [Fusarium sp. VM40]
MTIPTVNENFLYKPLDSGNVHLSIRVLQPLPGDISDPLSCTLENYADATEQGWTCLSYTWGTEPATKEITINGVSFLVRSNVYNFLQEARRRGLTNLWIDSICINQNDMEERNAQVGLMSRIFSDAKLVMVWLGQGSEATERAFRLLESGFPSDTVSISLASGKAVCCQMSSAECSSLFEACNAPIWTRRWVKQEILMPKTAILCYGQASVGISIFLALMDSLVDYSTFHSHAVPTEPVQEDVSKEERDEAGTCFYENNESQQRLRQCVNVLALYQTNRFKGRNIHLLTFLDMFEDSVCTDFHDHVYAFRGLMEQGSSLHVDYKLSNRGMFVNTLDFVARTTHPHLRGASPSERNFLANIYQGFNLTVNDLEVILASYRTRFLVQVGESFEMLRKDVSVWIFLDSITDLEELVSSAWRARELVDDCRSVLRDRQEMHEYHTVLNQLRKGPDMIERGVWLYGLRSWSGPSLAGLRAVYKPEWFYGCGPETAGQLNSLIGQGCPIMSMAFDPCGQDEALLEWLDGVKDSLIVTVTDRDDAGHQMQISVLTGCDSEECLLKRRIGGIVKEDT